MREEHWILSNFKSAHNMYFFQNQNWKIQNWKFHFLLMRSSRCSGQSASYPILFGASKASIRHFAKAGLAQAVWTWRVRRHGPGDSGGQHETLLYTFLFDAFCDSKHVFQDDYDHTTPNIIFLTQFYNSSCFVNFQKKNTAEKLEEHADHFIQQGTYLLMERHKMLVYRNLCTLKFWVFVVCWFIRWFVL